ncbi:hypothetical protein B9T31_12270 [Acinetobacter sp. ANC 4558]|uniref:hypothetical protein n=1 Tax=Acinetobacter sp. ANC 4558 TaxID=1977876 RepID=UPI000A355510|nr:hypothetical protein [Acinetobacter sp. ANC 4558]OTG85559.1 hypothetical protein B9T31_12270 [Acinetobacter sp. ANC 4558]
MSHILSIRGIGQPIAYFPKLSKYLGCVNAGIFLGQMVFWSDKTDNPLGVYKTSEEITEETGLSYKQQVSARKKLVSLGLISETYKRLDHRLFFKFNTERFDEWFSEVIFAEEQKVNSPNAETEFPELPKGHFGNTSKVCSGTDQIVDREQPKGQIVIQENTTEITTDIHTQENAPEKNEICEQWNPDLEFLKNILVQTKFSNRAEEILSMTDFQFHLGNFNAHWENKTYLTENQKTRKFASWLIQEFEKSERSAKAKTRSFEKPSRNVNDAWDSIPQFQGEVAPVEIPEDFV